MFNKFVKHNYIFQSKYKDLKETETVNRPYMGLRLNSGLRSTKNCAKFALHVA
jgi:hypothetical protein